MPALPESIFDVVYLAFAIGSGISLLKRKGSNSITRLLGLMALILGCGDAFHLVPRVLNYWVPGDWTAALGIGKLVTSITMTFFYLLLEHVRRIRYEIKNETILYAVYALSVARIILCLFPQNMWTSADAPLSWGIYRNIPFLILGILSIILWHRSAKDDKVFCFLWLAILLSFAFYVPVVLWADKIPLLGMLMLPKTVMYIWMIVMFKKA
ncbi:MAG: hypothetical protein J6P81_00770 [Spirochaetales bacterium]|nr:hypothetical protein [Spirochaetales bacterium]MBO6048660.1 hypothetical protein [Spirochaetales bacterium]